MSTTTLTNARAKGIKGLIKRAPDQENALKLADTESGWLTGRVVDETGNPLPFARLRIYLQDFETLSDSNGFFLIPCIPVGEYTVLVEHYAYDTRFLPHVYVGYCGTSLETVQMDERIVMFENCVFEMQGR